MQFNTREELYSYIPHGGVVAELGVQRGKNAANIWKLNQPSLLYLVDPWKGYSFFSNDAQHEKYMKECIKHFTEAIDTGKVRICRELGHEFLTTLPDNCLDWIYIDGNHEYEWVLKDLVAAHRAVKPSGYIVGHDYIRNEDSAFKEVRTRCDYGVIEAVNDFCTNYPWFLMCVTGETHYHPSFVLKGTKREN